MRDTESAEAPFPVPLAGQEPAAAPPAAYRPRASAVELAARNRELYDNAGDPVWHLAVYGPVHEGWQFINLGGRRLLDLIAERAGLARGVNAVDLCSGLADPCLYLAQHYGCSVAGVELNPQQVARARLRRAQAPKEAATRVRLIAGDVLRWRPRRLYDVALSIDSLMLIGDVPRFLRQACRCLRPGGSLLVATVVAGPAVTDTVRRFAWEVDGMINLPSPGEYAPLVAAAGFESYSAEDLTPLACAGAEKMDAALACQRDQVIELQGEETFRGWQQVGEFYLRAFRSGQLAYLLFQARRRADA